MNGSVRQDRNSFLVDIRWQGERCRIFSDKDGTPLDSKRRADRLLSQTRYEIDHGLFDPKNYVKRELKALLFVNHIDSWLGRQRLRVEAGEIAREYVRSSEVWVRDYLIPFFGKRRIRDVHEGMVEDLPRALSGYVFTYRGKPLQKKLTWRTWRTAAKKAGIDIGQYQGTKHSLGTWAVNNGVPLNIIQAYMGHKSSSTTKRYAKLQVESLKVMHREARAAEGQQVKNLRRK